MIARKAGLVKENPSAAVHTLFLGETNALPPKKSKPRRVRQGLGKFCIVHAIAGLQRIWPAPRMIYL